MQEVDDCWLSVSATTRQPREGEVDGVQYYFLSMGEFEKLADEGGFLEWATYSGNNYGTPRASVEEKMREGKQVILEIDVQGGFQIREKIPEAHLVFIMPPSLEVLRERLTGRGTETPEVIERRMQAAEVELSQSMEYDKRLVNDDLDVATQELVDYVNEMAERQ